MNCKRSGLAGFVAVAYGMHRMTAAELLAFANLAHHQGYPGVAVVALDEMKRRAA